MGVSNRRITDANDGQTPPNPNKLRLPQTREPPLGAGAWWGLSVHLPHRMKDVLTHWGIYCNESHDPEEGSPGCRLAPLRLDKALSVKDMDKLPLNPASQYLRICSQPGYSELINTRGLDFLLRCACFLGSRRAPA